MVLVVGALLGVWHDMAGTLVWHLCGVVWVWVHGVLECDCFAGQGVLLCSCGWWVVCCVRTV